MAKVIGVIFAALLCLLGGCKPKAVAPGGCGNAVIVLPCGQKLVSTSWSDRGYLFWYGTRKLRSGEQPETTTLHRYKDECRSAKPTITITECLNASEKTP
jgi:hypothetical protein